MGRVECGGGWMPLLEWLCVSLVWLGVCTKLAGIESFFDTGKDEKEKEEDEKEEEGADDDREEEKKEK